MKQKIIAFGVKVLAVPDHHHYFQAPGGQVFRLVGINEDPLCMRVHLHKNPDCSFRQTGSHPGTWKTDTIRTAKRGESKLMRN
jgi:hypothetical protein